MVVSQKTFSDAMDQINKAFEKLEARLAELEKPKAAPKKAPIDKK